MKTLFYTLELEEVCSLLPEQRSQLETLLKKDVAACTRIATRGLRADVPLEVRRENAGHYLDAKLADMHFLVIRLDQHMIGYVAMSSGWNSYDNEPAFPSILWFILDPVYLNSEPEILRLLDGKKEEYRVADEEW